MVPLPYIEIAISKLLFSCFHNWNIISRVLSITVNNVTNNDITIKNIKDILDEQNILIVNGSLLHQYCYAYILNLIVSDSFKTIKSIINKV